MILGTIMMKDQACDDIVKICKGLEKVRDQIFTPLLYSAKSFTVSCIAIYENEFCGLCQ